MIADLKPYPANRVAEGGWVGEIPAHWTVRRMKYVVREIDSRSTTGKEQLLRISQYTGVTQRRRLDDRDEPDTRADSLVGYKRVEPNDLVVNIMLAWNGSMGVSRYDGIASPAYCVYRFGPNLHAWYFHNLLRSPAYKARIKASSTGVVESRLRLYSDDLGRIEALVPPPDEQAAIVRFLDWANGRLERAIRAKLKVIALLNEQKQSIIHRAITRGLDSSVPLKPSGIPWLGDIPQHWEVTPLGAVTHYISYGFTNPMPVTDQGPYMLTAADIASGTIQYGSARRTSDYAFRYSLTDKSRPLAGDLLITKDGTLGRVAVADGTPVCINQSVALLRLRSEEVFREFISDALQAEGYQQMMIFNAGGTTIKHIYITRLVKMKMALPPLKEQITIAADVQRRNAEFGSATWKLEREIELLREYRTRLVADVVTGKLDVREAAERLPDEAPSDIVQEEADLGDEAEAADEEAAV